MSDLAAQYDDGVFEPDEETLISALRNQDDIPILMDIVAEKEPLARSQEAHLAQSFSERKEQDIGLQEVLNDSALQDSPEKQIEEVSLDMASDDVVTLDDVVVEPAISQELIAKAITDVLERRLPELVSEVMQTLQAADKTQKE